MKIMSESVQVFHSSECLSLKFTLLIRICLIIISLCEIRFEDVFAQEYTNDKVVRVSSPLQMEWELKTNAILLNHFVSGDKLYINTMRGIQAASLNDGKELWRYEFPQDSSVSSVVTFSNRYGLFTNYKKDTSKLILIDLSKGMEMWRIVSDSLLFIPTPMMNSDHVFCINGVPDNWNGLKDYLEMKLTMSTLTAFDINEGKVKWATTIESSLPTELIQIVNDNIILSYDLTEEGKSNKLMNINARNGMKKWEFDPSSFLNSKLIGGFTYFKNALYTFPKYGGKGQISRVDITTGKERWYTKKDIKGQRKFNIHNGKIYNSAEEWQCFNPTDGDELFSKSFEGFSFNLEGILTQTIASALGASLGNYLASLNRSYTNVLLLSQAIQMLSIIPELFSEKDTDSPKFIPTVYLFDNLMIKEFVNDKGMFSIMRENEEVFLKYSSLNEEENEVCEVPFSNKESDLCMSNGTNDSTVFVSSKGKIYAINLNNNRIVWENDFSNGLIEFTLGLLNHEQKLLMLTNKRVCSLVNKQ